MQSTDSDHSDEQLEISSNLFVGIMEGFAESVIPPLSELPQSSLVLRHGAQDYSSNGKGGGSKFINPKKRASSSHHHESGNVEKERSRRGKMAEMYSVLQSMAVPNPIPKITREAIVSCTIEHIKRLEKEVARLEDLKMKNNLVTALPESMETKPIISRCTNRSSSVEVRVYGGMTFFAIQLPARRGSVTEMFKVFERNQAEVLAANVVAAVDRRQMKVTVTAVVGGNRVDATIEKIRREIIIII